MTQRAIRRLASKMRSTHKKVKSWQRVAEIHKIVNSRGSIDKGLAYQIAVNHFEPTMHDTLIRNRLPCTCDKCIKQKRLAIALEIIMLFDLSSSELLRAYKLASKTRKAIA